MERMTMNYGDIVNGWCQHMGHSGAMDPLTCVCCGGVNLYYEPCSQCSGPCCYLCKLDHGETLYGDFPYQLFSVCRLLYEESARLFYSEARLEVVYTAPGGFDPVQRLGPLAIASLRNLVIRLNLHCCAGGPACTLPEHRRAECYSICRIGGHDEPLGKRPGSRYDRCAWQSLRDVCAHLARFLPANQLKLTFACEVRDYGLATKLMEALLQLPSLLSCTIALSLAPDPQLRELAQETQARLANPSLRVRGLPRHFGLRNLPREIQLEILRNSDLVAPFHLSFSRESNQPSKRPTLCVHWEPLQHLTSIPVVCCCSSSAHSSSGWTCDHWHFPDSLFLVDRQMEEDARVIMYSENSWVFYDIADMIPAWKHRPPPTPQSIPLDRMQANVSRFLANARRIQVHVSIRALALPGSKSRQTCMGYLSTLLEGCVPEKLRLVIELDHPAHPAVGLGTMLESWQWRDQQLMLRCLAVGLRGRRLREFAVGFQRKHFDTGDYPGYPYRVNCHVGGQLLDLLEVEIEDDFSERELSPSHHHLENLRLAARRVPVKIHSDFDWEQASYECPICGGRPAPNTLLYHG